MTDHDAIAEKVRNFLTTGQIFGIREVMSAYLDLYDEVMRLRADRKQGGLDYCDLMKRHDAHFVAWQSAKSRAEKAEAERDAAISTLDAWFDRRELGHDAIDQAVLDCAKGYLRTSRVGGMPQEESDAVLAVIEDMARLSVFADLFIRLDQERLEKAEAERDALRAHPYLPAEEIAAIERGNRRWHGEYDTTVSVRWEPYKPDGQRQMKVKGRWQTMTHNTSGYFRWENCDRPAQVRQALKGQTND